MTATIEKITLLPGALLALPAGGWEGVDTAVATADINLIGELRELARVSKSAPGCPPELETKITLREVPAERLRPAVQRAQKCAAWRLAGADDESIWDRLDAHFEIPQRRALGLVPA